METAIFVLCILAFTFSFFTFVSVRNMLTIFQSFLNAILKTMNDTEGKQ